MHLVTGNLGGDFYKGNLSNFTHLPLNIQQGIKLHRFIDDFTDHSEHILQVSHLLQENGIHKVAGIACDILLDHYLSRNWSNYSNLVYENFIQAIYTEVEANLEFMETDFRFLFNKMKEYGWFHAYPGIDGISLILRQFSSRVKFQNKLGESSRVYIYHQKAIDTCFKAFLSDIKHRSGEFILDQKLNLP
jgi:acyl carrier protein phosphodiesterase